MDTKQLTWIVTALTIVSVFLLSNAAAVIWYERDSWYWQSGRLTQYYSGCRLEELELHMVLVLSLGEIRVYLWILCNKSTSSYLYNYKKCVCQRRTIIIWCTPSFSPLPPSITFSFPCLWYELFLVSKY